MPASGAVIRARVACGNGRRIATPPSLSEDFPGGFNLRVKRLPPYRQSLERLIAGDDEKKQLLIAYKELVFATHILMPVCGGRAESGFACRDFQTILLN